MVIKSLLVILVSGLFEECSYCHAVISITASYCFHTPQSRRRNARQRPSRNKTFVTVDLHPITAWRVPIASHVNVNDSQRTRRSPEPSVSRSASHSTKPTSQLLLNSMNKSLMRIWCQNTLHSARLYSTISCVSSCETMRDGHWTVLSLTREASIVINLRVKWVFSF